MLSVSKNINSGQGEPAYYARDISVAMKQSNATEGQSILTEL